MSTAPLSYRVSRPSPRASELSGPRAAADRTPLALAAALLLLVLYAAFEHGAVGTAREARIQVAVAVLAAVAAACAVWSGSLRLSASRPAIAGAALLAGFAIWSGITLVWSVAPEQSWLSFNRALTYVIVLCLAIALGASLERPLEVISRGFVVIAGVVTLYGLGQKVAPGLHVNGVFNFNRTGPLPRLQDPLGYWNALALFVLMAVPSALALAVDTGRSVRTRLVALGTVELMGLVIGFTYSRGGLLALAIGLVCGIALSGARLRVLMWLSIAALATLPPLLFGLIDHSLTSAHVGLGARELAGAELGAGLAASLVALALGGRRLIRYEHDVEISAARARTIARLLAAGAAIAVMAALLAISVSPRGLPGTVSHAWKTFTTTRDASTTNSSRLLSADSANRWVWWKEAAGAFSDRPVTGWGAGSFAVVHRLYRQNRLSVQQPHNVALQFLSETGLVGAVLAIAAFALLLTAAITEVRRRPRGPERLVAAAVLAGVLAYVIHTFYDWDWDIPAVTLPALILLGVLVGRRGTHREREVVPIGWAVRAAGLVAVTLGMCVLAASAALPSIASSTVSSALVAAANGSADGLERAQGTAALAAKLDPLSDAGLSLAATLAIRSGQLTRARSYLLQAIGREPSDAQAWQSLALVEVRLGNYQAAASAAARMLALDPKRRTTLEFATALTQQALLRTTPPRGSATAVETPLG